MLPLFAAAALTLAIADGPPRSTPTRRSGSPNLALDCVHKEYPDKIAHVLNGDAGRAAAAQAHAGLLRLLRLALGRARPLAAGAAGPHLPEGAVRGPRARGARAQPDAATHRR